MTSLSTDVELQEQSATTPTAITSSGDNQAASTPSHASLQIDEDFNTPISDSNSIGQAQTADTNNDAQPTSSSSSQPPQIIQTPASPRTPTQTSLTTPANNNNSKRWSNPISSKSSNKRKKRRKIDKAKWKRRLVGTMSCVVAPCSCYSQGSGVLGNIACCIVWPVVTVAGFVWGIATCLTYGCCGFCG